jgi:Domain of unknown function (DUF4268)
MTVGRLTSVPLREVWAHEAHDFTVWLAENVDLVGDAIDLTLSDVRREVAAGTFSVDLVAVDESGRTVVIENQLERSDHDHLGKLITYLAVHEASVAVWIVRDPRPEHVAAITWPNKFRDVSLYMLKLEAVRIGDSPAAPILTLITGPTDELREAGDELRERSDRQVRQRRFWSELLDLGRGEQHTHAAVSASAGNWLDAGAGLGGAAWKYRTTRTGAEVLLMLRRATVEESRALYDALFAQRAEIEAEWGAQLRWDPKDGRKKCEIVARRWDAGIDDETGWPALQREMFDTMQRFAEVMRPAQRLTGS